MSGDPKVSVWSSLAVDECVARIERAIQTEGDAATSPRPPLPVQVSLAPSGQETELSVCVRSSAPAIGRASYVVLSGKLVATQDGTSLTGTVRAKPYIWMVLATGLCMAPILQLIALLPPQDALQLVVPVLCGVVYLRVGFSRLMERDLGAWAIASYVAKLIEAPSVEVELWGGRLEALLLALGNIIPEAWLFVASLAAMVIAAVSPPWWTTHGHGIAHTSAALVAGAILCAAGAWQVLWRLKAMLATRGRGRQRQG